MTKDSKYMIYRIYSPKERKEKKERGVFYGWTRSKIIRDAFLQQRTKGKYRSFKMYDEDIAHYYSEDITDQSTIINILKLKSAATGEEFTLFMTAAEVKQAEIDIQRMMEEACSLENIKADMKLLVDFFTNLNDYYANALSFIGYRPKEIDYMYPSADDEQDLTDVEWQIQDAYDGNCDFPKEDDVHIMSTVPGLMGMLPNQVANMVVYSLESFVKVMKNDL